jgi:hypothetical protein
MFWELETEVNAWVNVVLGDAYYPEVQNCKSLDKIYYTNTKDIYFKKSCDNLNDQFPIYIALISLTLLDLGHF